MSTPSLIEARSAIAECPIINWTGPVWRFHRNRYLGHDASGSLKVTGRFHRGRDRFSLNETWPALYTSLAQHVALGEMVRHCDDLNLITDWQSTELSIELSRVVNFCSKTDCSNLDIDWISMLELCGEAKAHDPFQKTHPLALAVREIAEALLVPSCTKFPEGNLVIFPDQLLANSKIAITNVTRPNLRA